MPVVGGQVPFSQAWLRRDLSSARLWALFLRYAALFRGGVFRFISRLMEEGLLPRIGDGTHGLTLFPGGGCLLTFCEGQMGITFTLHCARLDHNGITPC
jgi:hypothetical protein